MTTISFYIEVDGKFEADETELTTDELEDELYEVVERDWQPLEEGDEVDIHVEVEYE